VLAYFVGDSGVEQRKYRKFLSEEQAQQPNDS
jgi:hypothetical protein